MIFIVLTVLIKEWETLGNLSYVDKEFLLITINQFLNNDTENKTKSELIDWIKNLRLTIANYREPYFCSSFQISF